MSNHKEVQNTNNPTTNSLLLVLILLVALSVSGCREWFRVLKSQLLLRIPVRCLLTLQQCSITFSSFLWKSARAVNEFCFYLARMLLWVYLRCLNKDYCGIGVELLRHICLMNEMKCLNIDKLEWVVEATRMVRAGAWHAAQGGDAVSILGSFQNSTR